MRRPPPFSRAIDYPATAGTWLLALGVTIAFWAKADLSPLLPDARLAHGQLWRLLTSALPHREPFHLAFNLYWLWILGTVVEDRLGAARTFALFAFLAAGAQAAEYALLDGGVGLSGVGYGLFGMLWVVGRRDPERLGEAVDRTTATLFLAWFFLCVVATVTGAWEVANIAHAAGALLGALVGWVMTVPWQAARALPALALGLLIAAATVGRPHLNRSSRRGEEQSALGYAALREARDADAVWWLRDATTMNPRDASAWFNLAVSCARTKDFVVAAAAYTRAAELQPDNGKYRAARDEMRAYLEALRQSAPAGEGG
ncbi:MAG TPA: rhomboid family intramembrane serine protease [Tepidisphaeraceae bacterium]|nr:rhomboid family intramembrane serine protease [Tepidisphaeraceae bacterium]